MLIYKLTNRVNGKVYIGKTRRRAINRRWNEHVSLAGNGSPYHIHNAIRKYGAEVFNVEVLYRAKTVDELSKMETFFIVLHQSHESENGYNMTRGGDGTFGHKRTPEQIEAMRQRQLGRSPSREARERSSKTHKELWESRSVEDKATVLAHLQSVCMMGSESLKGRKRPAEVCLAISEGRKGIGRPQPIEVRMRIANTLREKNQLKRLAAKAGE